MEGTETNKSSCFFLYSYLHEVHVDSYNSKLYTKMLFLLLKLEIFWKKSLN